jgi:hypothetical protein
VPADPTDSAGKTLLIRNAICVATLDDASTELRDACVLIRAAASSRGAGRVGS